MYTAKGLADLIRQYTGTTSVTFTDTEMLPLIKAVWRDISNKIKKVNANIFIMPAFADLVANQREYPFPAKILYKMKFLEAKLDNVTYIPLDHFDMPADARYATDETTIVSKFANSQGYAKYTILRNSIFLFTGTITNVTNGLKLWYHKMPAYPTDLTENTRDLETPPSTTEHGMPEDFHELIARQVSIIWKTMRSTPIALSAKELQYNEDLAFALDAIMFDNEDGATVVGVADDGTDDGHNL